MYQALPCVPGPRPSAPFSPEQPAAGPRSSVLEQKREEHPFGVLRLAVPAGMRVGDTAESRDRPDPVSLSSASSGRLRPVPSSPGTGTAHWPPLSAQSPSGQPRAQCWGSSVKASAPSFPVTQPRSRGSGLRPALHGMPQSGRNLWPGSSLPRSKVAWPRASLATSLLPAELLPPAGHPHPPCSPPLPAQAALHRALVLACF